MFSPFAGPPPMASPPKQQQQRGSNRGDPGQYKYPVDKGQPNAESYGMYYNKSGPLKSVHQLGGGPQHQQLPFIKKGQQQWQKG